MFSRIVHGIAVLLALLAIVLLDRAFAQSQPNAGTDEVATFASRFSALTDAPQPPPAQPQPATTVEPQEHSMQTPQAAQPFALNAMPVTAGEVLDKWSALVAEIRSEGEILARCRSNAEHCPAAAKKFLDVIADGRAHDGRARIGVINRDINLAIRPTSDLRQWGVTDRWSAPLATLGSGRGDCEDYAIAKYVALREAGLAKNDVRLIIVRDLASGADHAVAAARVDEKWVMLDNRRFTLVEDTAMARVAPLFVFDDAGVKRFTTSFAETRRMPAPAEITSAAPSALRF
ncbi:MAG: transglutaminase-like cysteine peptidase [Xanthobacteraceae bacterium]